MLETKASAVTTYPRSAPKRELYPLSETAVASPSRFRTHPAQPLPETDRDSAHVGAPQRRLREAQTAARRLARSEARLLAVAVAFTVMVCGLLVVYLAAYAHVAGLGMDQARARVALRQARSENEMLQAEYAALRSPSRIETAAADLKMVRKSASVCYISRGEGQSPTVASADTGTPAPSMTETTTNGAGPEVASRGTTGEISTDTR